MESAAEKLPEYSPELEPTNVIRVETALSRYPVHRLARQGSINIQIRETDQDGEVLIDWKVSHNSEYGQPGPLAYKIDTLIVNRRIEEASRPVPKIIKLGSQAAIAEELGISTHDTRSTIKRALHQNASAYITAKLNYKLADGRTRDLEAGFSRYSVVFTGEELPDGRRAEAVYLVLNERFMQVLNGAQTRPLDYDYLRDLTPASQRLYELLSYQIYSALKFGRREARLLYSEYCTYAPLTRFLKWDQVRPQMARIHRPHKASRYIGSVEFEQTTDREGRPDWLMRYVPGHKARAEYRAFTKKGGPRTLEIEAPAPELLPTSIEQELIARGVTLSTARELVQDYPEERIADQVEQFDWLAEKQPEKVTANPGGYLVSAIRKGYAPPKDFLSKAERAQREEAKAAKKQQAQEEARRQKAERQREKRLEDEIRRAWDLLTEEEKAQLEAQALAEAAPEIRAQYEATGGGARRLLMVGIRQSYLRKQVEAAEAEDSPRGTIH